MLKTHESNKIHLMNKGNHENEFIKEINWKQLDRLYHNGFN